MSQEQRVPLPSFDERMNARGLADVKEAEKLLGCAALCYGIDSAEGKRIAVIVETVRAFRADVLRSSWLSDALSALTQRAFHITAETPDTFLVTARDHAAANPSESFRVPADCTSAAWLRGELRRNGWDLRDPVEATLELSNIGDLR